MYGFERYLQVGQDVKMLSGDTRVVLITDHGVLNSGLASLIISALKKEQIEVTVFSDIKSEPTSASIDEAARVIREFRAQCVIGLGGGSAMDVAKMAALMASGEQGAMHYALMANPFPQKRVKSIMIPTTSGTGAEVTSTVVFSDEQQRKVWGWDEKIAPELAIIDPTFTLALPRMLTAATTLDALVHAIEACAGKRSNPLIEAFSLQSIQLIRENFETVLQVPNDVEARGKLALAATLAGMAIENGGTGLAHCIGHALGTIGSIHHGRAVAISLNAVYEWNVEAAVDIHAKIAQSLGVNDQGLSKKELALAGAREFNRLIAISGLKQSLEDDGLSLADVDRFVETMLSPENEPMRLNNCRLASENDLRQFAEQILSSERMSHQV